MKSESWEEVSYNVSAVVSRRRCYRRGVFGHPECRFRGTKEPQRGISSSKETLLGQPVLLSAGLHRQRQQRPRLRNEPFKTKVTTLAAEEGVGRKGNPYLIRRFHRRQGSVQGSLRRNDGRLLHSLANDQLPITYYSIAYSSIPNCLFAPGPFTNLPGLAPVCSPSFSTCEPFTQTCCTPVE